MATATKAPKASGKNVGHVTQVIGSTFDVEFSEDSIPAIYNAVRIESHKKGIVLKRKGDGIESIQGMKIDDIKTMTTTATLFMTKPKKGAAAAPGGGGDAPGGDAPRGEAPPASAEGLRAKSLWARASSTHMSHASNRILEIMRQMEEMEQAEEEIA